MLPKVDEGCIINNSVGDDENHIPSNLQSQMDIKEGGAFGWKGSSHETLRERVWSGRGQEEAPPKSQTTPNP